MDSSEHDTFRAAIHGDRDAFEMIIRTQSLGQVQNFNIQTERVAQNASGLSSTAKVERDKVQLNLVISRSGEEPAVQQTRLAILTSSVPERVARLKTETIKLGGELRSSTFTRTPDGQELANLVLRAPMESYPALMKTFEELGKVKDVNILHNDRPGTIANPANAPVEISVQVYAERHRLRPERVRRHGSAHPRPRDCRIDLECANDRLPRVLGARPRPVGWLVVRLAKQRRVR